VADLFRIRIPAAMAAAIEAGQALNPPVPADACGVSAVPC
jgi:hypothetical protein